MQWMRRPHDQFAVERHVRNRIMEDVLKKANAVTKFVRKRVALFHHFRAKQRKYFGARQHRRALCLPVATRWYSSTNCIASVVNNEEVLREVFSNEALLTRYADAVVKLNHVEAILADSTFWVNARAVLRLVNPVVKALGALEKEGCCLSMVYYYFHELKNHSIYSRETDDVAAGIFTTIWGQIDSRWNTLKRESVLAAFLLDQSKDILAFEDNDLDKAVNACVDLVSRVGLPSNASPAASRRAVLAFVRMKKSWSLEEREQNSRNSPLDWWMLKSKRHPLLHAFATRVLSIPTSSAASERSWSVHAFLHNKRRDRLKPERVEKLVFVYSNTGDKVAISQVHYQENNGEENRSDTRSDCSEIGIESPEPSLRANTTANYARSGQPQSARARRSFGILTHSERSGCPTTPRARRTLFSPSNDFQLSQHSASRHAGEVEMAMTQTTFGGTALTRADECQLVSAASILHGSTGALTPTVQTSDRLVFSGGSSNRCMPQPQRSPNRTHHSPRRLFGPFHSS